ncbi:MAG TPA: hypothetical protein VGS98_06730 [Thermoanaerobaculia bacterium]|nr:hypothetical protein [Thermoanaerobaculia bacterium]
MLAIDVSPLAVRVARRRGVRYARVLAFERVGARVGRFDTVLMYGNNLGLLGGEAKARRLLGSAPSTHQPGRSDRRASTDPYRTDDPDHLAYHQWNRRRGLDMLNATRRGRPTELILFGGSLYIFARPGPSSAGNPNRPGLNPRLSRDRVFAKRCGVSVSGFSR